MQAYPNGFDTLETQQQTLPEMPLDLDLAELGEVWRRGSVISSWLLDLTAARSPPIDSSTASKASFRFR